MPNHVINYVTLKHSDLDKMKKMMEVVKKHQETEENNNEDKDGFFYQVKKRPKNIKDTYNWNINNWSTKWEAYDFEVYNDDDIMFSEITLAFNTAWSPPIKIFEALKKKGWEVKAEYLDECHNFVGEWIDGTDFCYNEVLQAPEHLRESFAIYADELEMDEQDEAI